MGVNASKVKYILDVDAGVTLRNVADGAETATATETAVSLKELNKAYWHDNEIPHGVFAVAVHVTALDLANSDETYTLSLVVDDAPTLNDNSVVVASYPIRAPGFYTFHVDSQNIPVLDPDNSGDDKWLGIRATLGGTSPSITYGAWIAKNIRP